MSERNPIPALEERQKIMLLRHTLARLRAMCEDLKQWLPHASTPKNIADISSAIQEIDETMDQTYPHENYPRTRE